LASSDFLERAASAKNLSVKDYITRVLAGVDQLAFTKCLSVNCHIEEDVSTSELE
jgi:hypothetical protein